ncbi:tetratricopeptide repeat protein [Lacinutrix salivirga]
MKIKNYLSALVLLLVFNCSKTSYDQAFIDQVSGSYLYTADETLEVYFEDQNMFLKWRVGDKIEPMHVGDQTIFIKDMNKKLKFVVNPKDKKQYLSVVPEDASQSIGYDYKKLNKGIKVPSQYLKEKQYDKALAGYLAIKAEDSTSVFINERSFNKFGYKLLKKDNYNDAIAVFKMNVALHPTSSNVYDSLAEAYLKSGDSLQAYTNYKNVLEYNTENRTAKRFVEAYNKK